MPLGQDGTPIGEQPVDEYFYLVFSGEPEHWNCAVVSNRGYSVQHNDITDQQARDLISTAGTVALYYAELHFRAYDFETLKQQERLWKESYRNQPNKKKPLSSDPGELYASEEDALARSGALNNAPVGQVVEVPFQDGSKRKYVKASPNEVREVTKDGDVRESSDGISLTKSDTYWLVGGIGAILLIGAL